MCLRVAPVKTEKESLAVLLYLINIGSVGAINQETENKRSPSPPACKP